MKSMIELASSGDAKHFMRELRVRSLFSNYFFAKAVLQYTKLTDYFHMPEMEEFIHRWSLGQTRQAVEWSRAFYKTTCFTVSTSIWSVLPVTEEDSEYAITKLGIPEHDWFRIANLHDQDRRQLLAFEVDTNAKMKVGIIKWHFEENELFRAVFPEIAYSGTEQPWNNQSLKIRRVGDGRREPEGTFDAIGVGGALQSRHYNTIWKDDLVGKKARDSETIMKSTIEWNQLLSGAFVDATRREDFLISNKWGFNDLNSWVRENEPDVVFHTRSCIEIDPNTGEEAAVFPVDGQGNEAYTIAELDKIAKRLSRQDYACQYMNRAVPPGEQEIDMNVLHYYTVSDSGEIQCTCGLKCSPLSLTRYAHYDPYNAKGNDSKSCPSIVVVGTHHSKHVFLLSYFNAKTSYAKIFEKIFEYNDKWRLARFTYEDVGNQNMAEFYIREKEKDKEHLSKHRKMPVIQAVTTKGKAKEVRIRDYFINFLRTGMFSCKKEHALFLSQLETFPYSVPNHDYDILDALAQGASLPWRFPQAEETMKAEKKGEDEYLAALGKPYTHLVINATA